MELVQIAELDLTYTALESIDYGVDGQLYGTMEGRLAGDRLDSVGVGGVARGRVYACQPTIT